MNDTLNRKPAVLIAGTHSGCGKTTVTLGIMAALQQRGLAIQPFKCGPDFIDPTLHQMVTGRTSRNLDVRMCGQGFTSSTFRHNTGTCDCAVIEGVMGLFDGGDGSGATLASLLNVPVILVVDVRSAAESVAAVIKGFATLDTNVQIGGVICNRVGSERHRQMIEDAVATYHPVPIIGFLPRNEEIAIPSRHLGLHMGEENPLNTNGQEQLGAMMEHHLNLDLLLELAHQAGTPASAGSLFNRRLLRRPTAFPFESGLPVTKPSVFITRITWICSVLPGLNWYRSARSMTETCQRTSMVSTLAVATRSCMQHSSVKTNPCASKSTLLRTATVLFMVNAAVLCT